LRNAFVGSFILLGIAVVIGTPIGILAGTWLGEFAVKRKLGGVVRFLNDILLSAPSIVVGLFAYAILVDPLGHFSAFSGGVALALILIPVVVRTTDEMLRLVPGSLREAAIALGTPYWKMVTKITWKAASTGILTGVILGIARISGETAPLLFTALNNQYFSSDVWHPMANLPVVIFQFAMSPYANWQQMAWAGAFVAVLFILILSLGSRWLINRGGVKS
jgi:phosphate transport system permease protein